MQLVELAPLIPSMILDMRYATANNVTGNALYNINEAAPRLDASAAKQLVLAAELLAAQNLRLVFWDGYRTPAAQAKLRAVQSDPQYVSDDSNHCRGIAVDVTLANAQGEYLDMGTDFDEFTERAHAESSDISELERTNRHILRQAMESVGFIQWPFEWWHYDCKQ